MKKTGRRISHGPALVLAQSQEEGLSLPLQTLVFLWVSDVCKHGYWLSVFPQRIFRWAMLEFITVIRIYVKDHFPSSLRFKFYGQTWVKRKDITSFNKPNKPTKEKGTDVSVLVGQHEWPCLPLENMTSGPGHQTQPHALTLGLCIGPSLFPIYPDLSISPLLDGSGKFHFRPSLLFL